MLPVIIVFEFLRIPREGRQMAEVRRFRMASDYFTADGLETLAGVPWFRYEAFILKELLDNALDATESQDARRVDVLLELTGKKVESLSVFDNGPGITGRLLDQIYAQFDSYVSSKKGYRAPTRGYQGNALKTVIGICALREFELAFLIREGENQQKRVDREGIEPPTQGFSVLCSTN